MFTKGSNCYYYTDDYIEKEYKESMKVEFTCKIMKNGAPPEYHDMYFCLKCKSACRKGKGCLCYNTGGGEV